MLFRSVERVEGSSHGMQTIKVYYSETNVHEFCKMFDDDYDDTWIRMSPTPDAYLNNRMNSKLNRLYELSVECNGSYTFKGRSKS